ncbi:MAG: bifunctional nicotinamidase/pyrazinamidase [Chlamydiales bacterium]
MKALIIIDVQNDFLPGGALPVKEGDQIIPIINELQKSFDLIVATKDWHPKDHISFAQTHGRQAGEILERDGMKQELWPVHCIQNSKGAEFPPSLKQEKIAKVFYKGVDSQIDSYSGFFDAAHRRSTGLAEYLKGNGCNELYFVGLATDYCVKYSVIDAATLHFKAYLILDACRGISPEGVEQAVEKMKAAGAEMIAASMV